MNVHIYIYYTLITYACIHFLYPISIYMHLSSPTVCVIHDLYVDRILHILPGFNFFMCRFVSCICLHYSNSFQPSLSDAIPSYAILFSSLVSSYPISITFHPARQYVIPTYLVPPFSSIPRLVLSQLRTYLIYSNLSDDAGCSKKNRMRGHFEKMLQVIEYCRLFVLDFSNILLMSWWH